VPIFGEGGEGMATGKINYRIQDGIGYITINNPQKMNALDEESSSELFSTLQSADDNPEVKVVILTGEGDRAFMCGQDINGFQLPDLQTGKKLTRTILGLLGSLESMSKPIIAAVNGLALGGGTEILMSCDMVVASENARFGLPESGIGVVPIWGVIRLAGIVGRHKAKELMMTGDIFPAKEALEIGLVNRVVPYDKLMETAEAIARKIITKAPIAIQLIKSAVNKELLPEGEAFTINANYLTFKSVDLKEGVNAFQNKRKPVFRGE
jgi:enoyl-CoA hydratase